MRRCGLAERFWRMGRRFASVAAAKKPWISEVTMARLKTKYQSDVVPAMMKEFGYKNTMQVPRLEKITLNVGLGEATQNIKVIDSAVAEITAIAGQKDRKSTRLNSSHVAISYAVFC